MVTEHAAAQYRIGPSRARRGRGGALMSSRLAGQKRSPWPGRAAICMAAGAIVAGLAWMHPPSRALLASATTKATAGLSLVNPALVSDYFLLQATLCPARYGFSCAPENQPPNLRVVPARRTL